MADLKISQLTGATTPLAGTEVLPIVQGGATKQVSVANLTAGRTQTSNGIVQGSAATGYNFTANTPAAGMTSQLLNWYEEGTWTPVLRFGGGSDSTYSVRIGNYTRIGRQVTLTCTITLTAKGASTGVATVTGFPFTTLASVPTVTLWQGDSVTFTGSYPLVYAAGGATDCGLFGADNAGTYTQLTHSNFSNTSTLRFSITYNV